MFVQRAEWALQCRVIVLGTTGTAYTFYEREKTTEPEKRIQEAKKRLKVQIKNVSCPPAGDVADSIERPTETIPLTVCVLPMEPFFLPVDIQHNQCPCRLFNPRQTSSVVNPRPGETTKLCAEQSRQYSAMSSYWIEQTRHPHALHEREKKTKEIKENTDGRQYIDLDDLPRAFFFL